MSVTRLDTLQIVYNVNKTAKGTKTEMYKSTQECIFETLEKQKLAGKG